MFILDSPYVSDFLKRSLQDHQIPVLQTPFAENVLAGYQINFISESKARQTDHTHSGLYTNSENALGWVYENWPDSEIAKMAALVKNKVRFREVLSEIHPDYEFMGVAFADLPNVKPTTLPYPLILKPSVGFFSLGVQRIENEEEWRSNLDRMDSWSRSYENLYPEMVLDNAVFIIEAVIPGDEFAVDCYYDHEGQAVILNMMKHLFSSGADVNDRVYVTSGPLVDQYLEPVRVYLDRLGALFKLANFQAHIELRIDENLVTAIEINPLRFGGWCSTADLAHYAWQMNLYSAVTRKTVPQWSSLTQKEPENIYALVVLNNSTGVTGKEIQSFDYDALLKRISEPLELRKTDYKQFPLFGFLMCKVPSTDMSELDELLHSDLREYIQVQSPG